MPNNHRFHKEVSETEEKRVKRRKLKWLKRQKRRKLNEPIEILDIDSSEIDTEQEVITSDQSSAGERRPTIRVHRTEDLISPRAPSTCNSVVLISSDSEESENPLRLSSPELNTRPAEETEIHIRLRSTQEMVEDSPGLPSNDLNVNPSSHCSNAQSSLIAPPEEISSSGDKVDQTEVGKTGIPFRVRTTAELSRGADLLRNAHIESSSIAMQLSDSVPLVNLSVTKKSVSLNAENLNSIHSSNRPNIHLSKSQFPSASTDRNVANCSSSQPGEALPINTDQSRVGKSGMPFRIRSTTELMSTTIGANICNRLNWLESPVKSPCRESDERSDSRRSGSRVSDGTTTTKVTINGGPAVDFCNEKNIPEKSDVLSDLDTSETNLPASSKRVKYVNPQNHGKTKSMLTDQTCPLQCLEPSGIGWSRSACGPYSPSRAKTFRTSSKKTLETTTRPADCSIYCPLSLKSSSGGRATDEQIAVICSDFPTHNDPSDSGRPDFNHPVDMDLCSGSDTPPGSSPEIHDFPSMRDDEAAMQSFSQPPPQPYQLHSPWIPTPYEIPPPIHQPYFYSEPSTPTHCSADVSNFQRGRPEKHGEIEQRSLNAATLKEQTFSLPPGLDLSSIADALCGPQVLAVQWQRAKRKHGRSEKECDIIDQLNKITTELRHFNVIKKALKNEPGHAAKIACQQTSNVFGVDMTSLSRRKSQLVCIQSKLIKQLKVERMRVGKIKEKRLEQLSSKQSQARSTKQCIQESSVILVDLDGESGEDQTPPVPAAKALEDSRFVYVNLEGELLDDKIPVTDALLEPSVVHGNVDVGSENDQPPVPAAKAVEESRFVYVNMEGELVDDQIPATDALQESSVVHGNVDVGSENDQPPVPAAKAVEESRFVYVNMEGELVDDQIPATDALQESSVVHVNEDLGLENDQTPSVPSQKSQTMEPECTVISEESLGGEQRVPSTVSVDDLDDGFTERDAVATSSPPIGKPSAGFGYRDKYDEAPKTTNPNPTNDGNTRLSDLRTCHDESKTSDQGSSVGFKTRVAPQGSERLPSSAPEPLPSSATLPSTPTSDKTAISDRNVAPPKLPWTALSDTSWDALYR